MNFANANLLIYVGYCNPFIGKKESTVNLNLTGVT